MLSIFDRKEITEEFGRRLQKYNTRDEGSDMLLPAIMLVGTLAYKDIFDRAHQMQFEVWIPSFFKTYLTKRLRATNGPTREISEFPRTSWQKEVGSPFRES